ncbi:MAG: universal stress protein, partial [Solirubrobacteraceae bacterium]
ERATLVAVGSHGQTRAAGIVFGSVATAMLHQAPCSVLVSHGTPHDLDPAGAGAGVVVIGFDGSGGARRALAAGRELSARLKLELHAVVALGGALVAPELPWVEEDLGDDLAVTEDPRPPVDALVEASRSADLVIVGSRHLPGVLSALTSVSERTAHRVTCPVLVVR